MRIVSDVIIDGEIRENMKILIKWRDQIYNRFEVEKNMNSDK